MKDQDSIFFKNFSIMLGGLVLLTIVLAVLGYIMHNNLLGDDVVVKDRTAIVKTIESFAKVNTGDAIVATKQEPDTSTQIADSGPADPQTTYQTVCFACHGTGAAGAPKLIAEDWTDRLPKGLEELTNSAINGIGVMPPKGGRADLSDEAMRSVVEFMLKDL